MEDLTAVFTELRKVFAPYASTLDVKKDDATDLYLDTHVIQKNRKPLFFGAVQRKKSHVSVHLMPVYVRPELLASVSRMQGKSCFNFRSVEPALILELAALVQAGHASYREQGFVP